MSNSAALAFDDEAKNRIVPVDPQGEMSTLPFIVFAYASVALRFLLNDVSDWDVGRITDVEEMYFNYLDVCLGFADDRLINHLWQSHEYRSIDIFF